MHEEHRWLICTHTIIVTWQMPSIEFTYGLYTYNNSIYNLIALSNGLVEEYLDLLFKIWFNSSSFTTTFILTTLLWWVIVSNFGLNLCSLCSSSCHKIFLINFVTYLVSKIWALLEFAIFGYFLSYYSCIGLEFRVELHKDF